MLTQKVIQSIRTDDTNASQESIEARKAIKKVLSFESKPSQFHPGRNKDSGSSNSGSNSSNSNDDPLIRSVSDSESQVIENDVEAQTVNVAPAL